MSKVSVRFLAGFALMSSVTFAAADGVTEAHVAAMKAGMPGQAAALGIAPSGDLKLNAPISGLNQMANILTRNSIVAPSSERGLAGALDKTSIASARLGTGSAMKSPTDESPFAAALGTSGVANSISAKLGGPAGEASLPSASAAIGIGGISAIEAASSQASIAAHRIGR